MYYMNITTNTFVEKDENKDENDIIINESNEVNYSKYRQRQIILSKTNK